LINRMWVDSGGVGTPLFAVLCQMVRGFSAADDRSMTARCRAMPA